MIPAEAIQTCYVCKKLFCCKWCRKRHEESKHTSRHPKCPFCMNQQLPLKSIEDKVLLCHIAVTHLPLYCHLCGEVFKQIEDLESFDTCKWWKSRHRHSLMSEQKPVLGTPPLTSEEKELSAYNGKFGTLTSPPELYRNTSTPMVVGQKTSFDFKTPNAPNFSLKTPKTGSASLKTDQTRGGSQASSLSGENSSNYVSFPSTTSHEETPFRSLPANRGNSEDPSQSKSRMLDVMKDADKSNRNECYTDNNQVEDMELTNVGSEALPDSQNLVSCQSERRSDSIKKVRFSDEHESHPEPSSTATFNMTENEEYFEACDSSEMKLSLEKSQIKVYEDNAKNMEKENRSPDRANANESQQPSSSSRVLMMVVVENNSSLPTSALIESGLKKLERITSSTNLSTCNRSNSPSCSSSITSADSYYSVSSHNYYSPSNKSSSPTSGDSSTSLNSSNDSNSSGGILSAVANAVRSVMKNISAIGSSRSIEREQVHSERDVAPGPSGSESFNAVSSFASSLLQRPGKRPRDTIDSALSTQRQPDFVVPQVELRSPLAKRQCGWYKVKAREPIARMRNSRQLASSRGVSSETQVFHQGSLLVGNTVLPLPDRAHQSTQTD